MLALQTLLATCFSYNNVGGPAVATIADTVCDVVSLLGFVWDKDINEVAQSLPKLNEWA